MRLASEFTDSSSGVRSRSGTRPPAEMTSVRSELASRRARQPFPLAAAEAIVDACVAQTPASARGSPRGEELGRGALPQPTANVETVLSTIPLLPVNGPAVASQ
jgi:hypothetical protein